MKLITTAHKYHCDIAARHLKGALQGELVLNARLKDGRVEHGAFIMGGVSLCVGAYRQVVGWSDSVWYPAKEAVRAHIVSGKDASCPIEVDVESNTPVQCKATTEAYGWCHARLDEFADGVDPSSRGPRASQRMLDRQDQNEWFLEYLQTMEDRKEGTVSFSTFTKMYAQARKELNVMDREWLPFAQCKECARIKLRLSKETSKEIVLLTMMSV